ncbi:hypothetical protein H1S01_03420 [Heliobacterium chlorum]|uniref:Uncharacterized protein n=1 Tax=Heliobacterium chlorum TaxID=2698 RepID=A0ABR7T0D2_HELCL|nr:hypothetical protein [Heliobacterium chlorum]MBC9783562.1 hypothetical protein [Heliobacterium chlorum]
MLTTKDLSEHAQQILNKIHDGENIVFIEETDLAYYVYIQSESFFKIVRISKSNDDYTLDMFTALESLNLLSLATLERITSKQ